MASTKLRTGKCSKPQTVPKMILLSWKMRMKMELAELRKKQLNEVDLITGWRSLLREREEYSSL